MTAAIYVLRAKKTVAILEKAALGGQIINTTKIENYPGLPGVSGVEFAQKLKEQVEKFGGEILYEKVEGVEKHDGGFVATTDEGEIFAKAVIIANGSAERKLGLAREEELVGQGVSYCATCDGGFFKGKRVAVFGGGNTALYSAIYLSHIAEKVYLSHRRGEFRAERQLVEKAKEHENIEFKLSRIVTELVGEKKLEKIELKNPETNETEELEVEGLFVTIGRVADNEKLRNLVELDENGYIKSDESCETSEAGVFAAGDTRAKRLHQLVTATADGAVAATAAIKYLNGD